MPYSQQTFDSAVWKIVAAIPSGRVRSYGEVARAAGFPRHARMVSKAMGRSPAPLPWHRVVRGDRSLAFGVESAAYQRQRGLLADEGVALVNGRVVPVESDDAVALDRLLWGPGR